MHTTRYMVLFGDEIYVILGAPRPFNSIKGLGPTDDVISRNISLLICAANTANSVSGKRQCDTAEVQKVYESYLFVLLILCPSQRVRVLNVESGGPGNRPIGLKISRERAPQKC